MSAAADALMGIFGFKRVDGEMSKSVEEVRRAAFEAACTRLGYSDLSFKCWGEGQGCNGCNDYEDDRTSELYEFFSAALDSICIELPDERSGDDDISFGYGLALADCRAAIEQTGLGLRVK